MLSSAGNWVNLRAKIQKNIQNWLWTLSGSEAALQQAKYNIERHYAVVGFLEDMVHIMAFFDKWEYDDNNSLLQDSFLHVLARVLPQFFSGIYQRKFEDNGKLKVPKKNKGSAKVPLSEEARW